MTRAVIDAQYVTGDRGHVTAAVVDGRAGQAQADDGNRILSTYREFFDIFSKKEAKTLPPHRSTDHAIDLETGTKLPYGRIYSLSKTELKTLKAYIETNLANGFIEGSLSPAASPILFVKKKDGSLRLCVDYRALKASFSKESIPVTANLRDLRESRKGKDLHQARSMRRV
jgi:hypothetical protein